MLMIVERFGKYELEVAKARNEESANLMIETFKKKDRYSVETEKYPMPEAWEGRYPEYFIKKIARKRRA